MTALISNGDPSVSNVKNCDANLYPYQTANLNYVCQFDVTKIPRQCGPDNQFGFSSGKPCVFLRANKVCIYFYSKINESCEKNKTIDLLKRRCDLITCSERRSDLITCSERRSDLITCSERRCDSTRFNSINTFLEWPKKRRYVCKVHYAIHNITWRTCFGNDRLKRWVSVFDGSDVTCDMSTSRLFQIKKKLILKFI